MPVGVKEAREEHQKRLDKIAQDTFKHCEAIDDEIRAKYVPGVGLRIALPLALRWDSAALTALATMYHNVGWSAKIEFIDSCGEDSRDVGSLVLSLMEGVSYQGNIKHATNGHNGERICDRGCLGCE